MVFDTNVLIDAANTGSEFHDACGRALGEARLDPSPAYLTWSVCYEFLRVTTHPRVLTPPWSIARASAFLEAVLATPSFGLLVATPRHLTVLADTVAMYPQLAGNVVHDLHTAVLMREHGISRICTRDADFRRFPFLTVIDPLR